MYCFSATEWDVWCYKFCMMRDYFIENLRALMKETKQRELAEKAGVSRSNIANWFSRGSVPRFEEIEKLAAHFNVEPYYFFMKPGTQGSERPQERDDSFKVFLDRRATELLSEMDLRAYHAQGGSEQFVKQMVDNYETPKLAIQDWYQILAAEVARYAGLNLIEKVRKLYRKDDFKKGESA